MSWQRALEFLGWSLESSNSIWQSEQRECRQSMHTIFQVDHDPYGTRLQPTGVSSSL